MLESSSVLRRGVGCHTELVSALGQRVDHRPSKGCLVLLPPLDDLSDFVKLFLESLGLISNLEGALDVDGATREHIEGWLLVCLDHGLRYLRQIIERLLKVPTLTRLLDPQGLSNLLRIAQATVLSCLVQVPIRIGGECPYLVRVRHRVLGAREVVD